MATPDWRVTLALWSAKWGWARFCAWRAERKAKRERNAFERSAGSGWDL
jgi:hypothetical protein